MIRRRYTVFIQTPVSKSLNFCVLEVLLLVAVGRFTLSCATALLIITADNWVNSLVIRCLMRSICLQESAVVWTWTQCWTKRTTRVTNSARLSTRVTHGPSGNSWRVWRPCILRYGARALYVTNNKSVSSFSAVSKAKLARKHVDGF